MKSRSAFLAFSAALATTASAIPARTVRLEPRAYSVYTKCRNSGDFALTLDE